MLCLYLYVSLCVCGVYVIYILVFIWVCVCVSVAIDEQQPFQSYCFHLSMIDYRASTFSRRRVRMVSMSVSPSNTNDTITPVAVIMTQ